MRQSPKLPLAVAAIACLIYALVTHLPVPNPADASSVGPTVRSAVAKLIKPGSAAPSTPARLHGPATVRIKRHLATSQMFGPPMPANRFAVNPTGYISATATPAGTVRSLGFAGTNTATGAFTVSATDAALSSAVLPFQFSRFYTSADKAGGPLGPGWTASYFWTLRRDAHGNVTVYSGWGQRVRFTRRKDGAFVGATGSESALVHSAAGYALTLGVDGLTLGFDEAGRLIRETSLRLPRNAGHRLHFDYRGGGVLRRITDTVGRQIEFAYTKNHRLKRLTLPDGRHVDYSYKVGRLVAVADEAGHVVRYLYTGGRLTAVVDQDHQRIQTVQYTPDGRVASIADALGHNMRFRYRSTSTDSSTTIIDPLGHRWVHSYSEGRLIAVTDPLGDRTALGYDSDLHITSVTSPRGSKYTFAYRHNDLVAASAPPPLAYQVRATYTRLHQPLRVTDGRHLTTRFLYDRFGDLRSVEYPNGGTTTYSRDRRGAIVGVRDAMGHAWTIRRDRREKASAIIDPTGGRTTFGYDVAGRLVHVRDPNGRSTRLTWNKIDQLSATTNAVGARITRGYDPAGMLTRLTDALGNTRRIAYNGDRWPIAYATPLGETTSVDYDATGHVIGLEDPNGHATTYRYDAAGRLVERRSPTGSVWRLRRDRDGLLTSVVTPSLGAIALTRDAMGRVTGMAYTDDTPAVTYEYDADNNLTSVSSAVGSTRFVYDSLNRRVADAGSFGRFSYVRDRTGNEVAETYPDGYAIRYGYDGARNLVLVKTRDSSISRTIDAGGRLLQTRFANGIAQNRSYDAAGRVAAIRNIVGIRTLSKFFVAYDADGRPTTETGTDGTHSYRYDADGRLVEECLAVSCAPDDGDLTRYQYDPAGNRVAVTRGGAVTAYSYDADNKLLSASSSGGVALNTYDLQGNESVAAADVRPGNPASQLVAVGANALTHNLANELVAASSGTVTAQYTYDGQGQEIASSVGTQPGSRVNFVWDHGGSAPVLAIERDGAGATMRRYVNVGRTPGLLQESGSTFTYLGDWRGNVANVVSADGNAALSYTYDAFGVVLSAKSEGHAPENPRQALAAYTDRTTGLTDLGGRHFNPTTGRFAEVIVLPHGIEHGDPCAGNCPRDCHAYLACGPSHCWGFSCGGGGGSGGGGWSGGGNSAGGGMCDPTTSDCGGSCDDGLAEDCGTPCADPSASDCNEQCSDASAVDCGGGNGCGSTETEIVAVLGNCGGCDPSVQSCPGCPDGTSGTGSGGTGTPCLPDPESSDPWCKLICGGVVGGLCGEIERKLGRVGCNVHGNATCELLCRGWDWSGRGFVGYCEKRPGSWGCVRGW